MAIVPIVLREDMYWNLFPIHVRELTDIDPQNLKN